MAHEINADYIFDVIADHLSPRDDFWHIVNGPKRETWFTAELIAALSRADSNTLTDGRRVYGEESYSSLVNILNKGRSACDATDLRKQPDVSMLGDYGTRLDCIIEVKLCTDFKPDILDNADGHLQNQMDRASRIFPDAVVIGVIFVVHNTNRGVVGDNVAAQPKTFYAHIKKWAEQVMDLNSKYQWCFTEGIRPVPCLQEIQSLGGMFNSFVSLGVGLIEKRT